jgi:L-lactate utilization protein LutB
MKRILLSTLMLVFTLAEADCTQIPRGENVATALTSKNYNKAKELLATFKLDIKTYLDNCNQSKEMFEQTHVSILTYEDKLADLKHDLNKKSHSTDCAQVPSSKTLEEAFKAKNSKEVKVQYAKYKKEAHDYIEHCASHAEYETVFESSMFCDEMYDEWVKKTK